MKNLGWILLATAFASALLMTVFGREDLWLLVTFGITWVLGSVLLALSFAIALYRRDIRLRPWDAAKRALALFLIVLGARLAVGVIFPSLGNRDLTETVAVSAIFAIVFGLYVTAYRRPA